MAVLLLREHRVWVRAGMAGITGDLLLLIVIMIVVCALPCIRRKGYFEVRLTNRDIPNLHKRSENITWLLGINCN